MSFTKIYQEKKDAFEVELARILNGIDGIPELLRTAMEYSLLSGGKRLRPVLFLETLRAFNETSATGESALLFAVAIECIHSYSLIHDDLPCMDDDDFRRGKPTNHKMFGEGIAVLAGDALLNLAYELMTEAASIAEDKARYLKAAALVAKNVGSRGLIAGQVADITAKDEIPVDLLKYIFRHKTGDLIISACASAAVIGGADQTELAHICGFADRFAYAFQVKDDILDYREKKEKTPGVSFVKVYGVPRSNQTLGDSTHRAQQELSALTGRNVDFLKQLTVKFASRKE